MPEPKKRGTKRLLLALVLMYAAFTLIPAAVYGASHLGTAGKGPESGASASADSASGTASAPESAPASESSAAQESAPSSPPSTEAPAENASSVPGFLDDLPLSSQSKGTAEETFILYDAATGRVFSVSTEEFLPAALACEMDLSAPKEALKAQAVAIYTLYSRQRETGEAAVHGADFACDSENWLFYVPKEAMQERWGEDFEEHYSLLQEVAQEVSGQLLTREGKPICAAYFAISAGSTEAAENVWGGESGSFPYLQAVASPGDRLSDGYLSTAVLTEEEFREAASTAFSEDPPDLSGPAEDWLREVERTPSGYVKSAVLGGKTVSGPDLRAAFSLRSACFQPVYENGAFTFTVRGWGHGVGMSQAGAVFLAKQGADYREILAHYYPGAALTSPA